MFFKCWREDILKWDSPAYRWFPICVTSCSHLYLWVTNCHSDCLAWTHLLYPCANNLGILGWNLRDLAKEGHISRKSRWNRTALLHHCDGSSVQIQLLKDAPEFGHRQCDEVQACTKMHAQVWGTNWAGNTDRLGTCLKGFHETAAAAGSDRQLSVRLWSSIFFAPWPKSYHASRVPTLNQV